ncbi:MAG: PLP-dependent aminotransferase family protein, partial [Gemmatimonadota bacterium]
MLLALDGPEPLHQQVYSGLRCAILRGDLRPGTRLPSSRGLAEELSVSRTTVVLAFDQLRAEGYVCGRHGSGTYVVEELPDLRPDPVPEPESPAPASGPGAADVSLSAYAARLVRAVPVSVASPARIRYDFRYGKLAVEEFPHDVWRRLHNNRSRMVSPRSVSYGDPEGHTRLREAVADYLVRARGVRCRAEQILIVNGSQQALDLAARVLIDPGDAVLMEEPTYHGARVCFEAVGATIVSGPVDIHGLQTADLARRAGPARVAYVTPSHQFPTGATMCLYRRLELLDWAASAGAVVFEDDYDSEFRYEGRPIQSLQGLDEQGSVIYAG